MRKFLFIFGLILAYLVFSSKSCGSDEKDDAAKKEAELTETKQNIRNEFASDDLSRKSLKAFEVKAKQELVDFSDYLGICSDKQLDASFKSQARQMIMDMFVSDSVQVNSHLINGQDGKKMLLNEFLNLEASSSYHSLDFTFDSIEIAKPFRRIDDFNYKGRLTFSRQLKGCNVADTVLISPAKLEAEIYVSKVYKPFGKDTLLVWSVFLGNIN